MTVIAVDCGGTSIRHGVFRDPTHLLASGIALTPEAAPAIPGAIIDAVAAYCDDDVAAIGIGVAGLVDAGTGSLVWMPHSSGHDIDVAGPVGDAFGLPTIVDNDTNLAGLAEATMGAGEGAPTVLMVTLGTGIGGALIVGGRIERGRGFAGEIGHMKMAAAGDMCRCGGHGCWETLVSGRALDDEARRLAGVGNATLEAIADGGLPSAAHLTLAAAAGDAAARAALHAAGGHLGSGLADLVAILDPDAIVIGGGAGAAGEPLLSAARAALASGVEGAEHREPTPVIAARFGDGAGLVGAALAAERAIVGSTGAAREAV